MKNLILIAVFIFSLANVCEARTFGCFAGILGADTSQSINIVYNNRELFYHKKNSTELLPFLGCGISFDF